MNQFKIGIIADWLQLPFAESMEACAKMGADGVQLYAVEGEMAPENLTSSQRREKRTIIEGNGLKVSALCGDLGGHGFTRAEENLWKIERSKRIVDLALELGSKGVAVNLDPANLVMVTDDDPVKAVYTLRDYIVHTHAKDGILLQKTDPKIIYDFFADGGIGDLRLGDYFLETPLGQGKVDFDAYLAALTDIGFQGFLTIEREVGANPAADIAMAAQFLRQRMG